MRYGVKNWCRFQHYKHRNPPWIKLYRDILNDPDWHNLPADTAKVLVMLWLLACEDPYTVRGGLPDVPALAFRLRITEDEVQHHLDILSAKWITEIKDVNDLEY